MGQKSAAALRAELRLHRSDVPAALPLAWAHPCLSRRQPPEVAMNTGVLELLPSPAGPSAAPRHTCRRPVLSALRCLHLLETACEHGAGGRSPSESEPWAQLGKGPPCFPRDCQHSVRSCSQLWPSVPPRDPLACPPGWVPAPREVTTHGGGYTCGGVHLCLHQGL